jgi:hypothetical protein
VRRHALGEAFRHVKPIERGERSKLTLAMFARRDVRVDAENASFKELFFDTAALRVDEILPAERVLARRASRSTARDAPPDAPRAHRRARATSARARAAPSRETLSLRDKSARETTGTRAAGVRAPHNATTTRATRARGAHGSTRERHERWRRANDALGEGDAAWDD